MLVAACRMLADDLPQHERLISDPFARLICDERAIEQARNDEPLQQVIRLRTEPANVGGKKARTLFETGPLFRPLTPVCNRLEIGTDTVLDRATGLAWQRRTSVYPLSWRAAHDYIDQLNAAEPDTAAP